MTSGLVKHTENNKIAVIIVNYNAGENLQRCIKSVKNQTLAPEKLILIDNNSTDGSITEELRADNDILLTEEERNSGFAAACNYGASLAENIDWLLFLNPDAFLEKDYLEKIFLDRNKDEKYASFVGMLLNDENDKCLDGAGDVYHVSGNAWRYGHGMQNHNLYNRKRDIFSPCGAAAVISRKVFMQVGGFDEDYFCYFEDVDLGFRMQLAGYKCEYIPTAIARHIGSLSSGSKHSPFAVYHGHRNLVWCYFSNMPAWFFWIYLPQHILLNIVTILVYIVRGQTLNILKCKWDALKGIPKALSKRKTKAATRTVSLRYLSGIMEHGIFKPYSILRKE